MAAQQYTLSAQDRAELNRIRRKLDSIRGPGVTNTPDAIYITTPPPGKQSRPTQRTSLPVPQYTGMVVQAVVGNALGADWVRAHGVL